MLRTPPQAQILMQWSSWWPGDHHLLQWKYKHPIKYYELPERINSTLTMSQQKCYILATLREYKATCLSFWSSSRSRWQKGKTKLKPSSCYSNCQDCIQSVVIIFIQYCIICNTVADTYCQPCFPTSSGCIRLYVVWLMSTSAHPANHL